MHLQIPFFPLIIKISVYKKLKLIMLKYLSYITHSINNNNNNNMVCCSFCRSLSHTVNNCCDVNLLIIYNKIRDIYAEIMNLEDCQTIFKNIIKHEYNLRELRSVCVNQLKLRTTSIGSKSDAINKLYLYFSDYNAYTQNNMPVIQDIELDMFQDLQPDMPFIYLEIPALQPIIPALQPIIPALQPIIPVVKKSNIITIFELTDEEDKEEKEEDEECAICFDNIKWLDLVYLNCSHKFCGNCINSTLSSHKNKTIEPSCALCRKKMSSFSVKNIEVYKSILKCCL